MSNSPVDIVSSNFFDLTLLVAPETVFPAACSIQFCQIKKAKLNPCLARRLPSSIRVFSGQAET